MFFIYIIISNIEKELKISINCLKKDNVFSHLDQYNWLVNTPQRSMDIEITVYDSSTVLIVFVVISSAILYVYFYLFLSCWPMQRYVNITWIGPAIYRNCSSSCWFAWWQYNFQFPRKQFNFPQGSAKCNFFKMAILIDKNIKLEMCFSTSLIKLFLLYHDMLYSDAADVK